MSDEIRIDLPPIVHESKATPVVLGGQRTADDIAADRVEFERALHELGASDGEVFELSTTTDLYDCIDAIALAHERLASLRSVDDE